MRPDNYVGIALDELYRMFDLHNAKWFKNALPSPIITIQSAGRKSAYGWFSLEKIWDKTNGTEQDSKHEINLCAEHLSRSMVEIASTLQHEMVHYHNKLADIKDNTDNVHNKKFKYHAERAGLLVSFSPKAGWGHTEGTDEFITFVNTDVVPNPANFVYFRNAKVSNKPKKEVEKKTFIYTCPQCEQEIKGKKGVSAVCGICAVPFIMEDE